MTYKTSGDTDETVVFVQFDDGTYPMPLKTANKVLEIMDKQIATEDALTADIARLTAEIKKLRETVHYVAKQLRRENHLWVEDEAEGLGEILADALPPMPEADSD